MHFAKVALFLGVLAQSTGICLANKMSASALATPDNMKNLRECAGDTACLAKAFHEGQPPADMPRLFSILGDAGWNPAPSYSVTHDHIASLTPENAETVVNEVNKYLEHANRTDLQVQSNKNAFTGELCSERQKVASIDPSLTAEAAAIQERGMIEISQETSLQLRDAEKLKAGYIALIAFGATVVAGMFFWALPVALFA